MKVKCLHGYFIFEETRPGQAAELNSIFGLNLKPKNNYFTFETLVNVPAYTLVGSDFLGVPALETFEGKPWEIMEQNGLIYDFSFDLIKPITAVTAKAKFTNAGFYLISQGLIVPGAITDNGSRVKSYSAWFFKDTMTFRYSEVTYV